MESHRVHRLEKVSDSGAHIQIGGAIVEMDIVGFSGSLSEISVQPVSEEERDEFRSEAYIRLQVADRLVWMEPEEVEAFMTLLRLSLNESQKPSEK